MAGKENGGSELNLIAAGTLIEGKIRVPGNIRIDGKVVGEVSAAQNISVGPQGAVEGNITARNVTIGGKVSGNILAQEKLVFETKASVSGDIKAIKLVIDEGAIFDGTCKMSGVQPQHPGEHLIAGEGKPDAKKREG